jgi:hypothetical protein
MNKKTRLARIITATFYQEQDTLNRLERALRPAVPDRKLARRIKQRLTAEWLARHLLTILVVGIACGALVFGTSRGKH